MKTELQNAFIEDNILLKIKRISLFCQYSVQNTKKDNQQNIINKQILIISTLFLQAMYYFKYEHKVQMIPYIEQQLTEYLRSLERDLPTMNNDNKVIVRNLLNRKARKIQQFYYRDFVDYRSSFILRSKKLIEDFFINFAEYFPNIPTIKAEAIRKQQPIIGTIKSPMKDSKPVEEPKKQKKDKQEVKVVSRVSQYLNKNINNSNEKKPSEQKCKKKLGQISLKKQTENEKNQKVGLKNSPKTQVKVSAQLTRQRVKTEALGSSNTWQTKKIQQSPSKIVGKVQQLRKGSQVIKKPTKQQYIKYLRNKQKQ